MNDVFYSEELKGVEHVNEKLNLLFHCHKLFTVYFVQDCPSIFIIHNKVNLAFINKHLMKIN